MPAFANPLDRSPVQPVLRSRWRAIDWQQALPVSLICLPLLWLRIQLLVTPLPLFDFMSYWVAGRFFLAGVTYRF